MDSTAHRHNPYGCPTGAMPRPGSHFMKALFPILLVIAFSTSVSAMDDECCVDGYEKCCPGNKDAAEKRCKRACDRDLKGDCSSDLIHFVPSECPDVIPKLTPELYQKCLRECERPMVD